MNKNTITWVVVADAHSARIFSKIKKEPLALIHQLSADLDFEHKKPGRTFNSTGSLRHAVEPHTDPKDVEKQHFVEKIIPILKSASNNNEFEDLILVASPKMLGILGNNLGEQLTKKLVAKLDKNITSMKDGEIEDYLNQSFKK